MGKVINVQMDEDFYDEIIQGGGSGNGSGDGSSIEYLDIRAYDTASSVRAALVSGAICGKMKIDGKTLIASILQGYILCGFDMGKLLSSVEAISIDLKMEGVFNVGYELQTLEEFLQSDPLNIDLNSIPRITKEQFYSLE